MKSFALTIATSFGLTFAAYAGEQFVDETGFAVSGYDVVAYRSLEQAQVGGEQPAATPGKADITAEYNGATFAFESVENRDSFLKNPAKYAPQYDGHCAYGVAENRKVPANPNLWRIVDGKLYLNISRQYADRWETDIPGYIETSESNWPDLEDNKASSASIPDFTSTAPEQE